MNIRMYNGGISNPNTSGGRQTDLQRGERWPASIPNGAYIVNNHTIDRATGTGNRTDVVISCGFLNQHPIGAILTRSKETSCRVTRENENDTIVVSEQVASVLMFQRQGIEMIIGDPQNDTLVGNQLHIHVTAIERNGIHYNGASRFEQVVDAINQLQQLLAIDISEGLRLAIQAFASVWEDPECIRNGTTHDAFLELRERFAAYDEAYDVGYDLVAHLTGNGGMESASSTHTNTTETDQEASTNEQQSSSQSTASTLPQAAKDAIGQRAIEVVTEDLHNRGQSVTNVETAASAQAYLGVDWPGYDLLVDQDLPDEEHIEVKGTQIGEGGNVRLTRTEMEAACTDPLATLAVVSSVTCHQNSEGAWVAEGGELRYYRWCNTSEIQTFLQPLQNGNLPGLSGVVSMNFPISPATSELTDQFER